MDLRTCRKNKGLTQKELAEKLEIDQAHLSKLERNEVGASLELALKISDFFNGRVNLKSLLKSEAR